MLGHIQRGGSPSSFDAVLASRMGAASVEGLLEGRKGFMVGYVNGQITSCPLPTAWETRKPLNHEMMALVESLSI